MFPFDDSIIADFCLRNRKRQEAKEKKLAEQLTLPTAKARGFRRGEISMRKISMQRADADFRGISSYMDFNRLFPTYMQDNIDEYAKNPHFFISRIRAR